MAHLDSAYKCNNCNQIPESGPLYHCPFRHRYCLECFIKIQKDYHGELEGGACCKVCKYRGRFEKDDVDLSLLKKLKIKPGIGRPCRYTLQRDTESLRSSLSTDSMAYSQGDVYTRILPPRILQGFTSKRPIQCLHGDCKKSVAISSLVSHFKHEHQNVPRYNVFKSNDLKLLLDISSMEHSKTFCLAMITAYEINKINVNKSRSSQSVRNACSKLSGPVPVNIFWLMVSCSSEMSKSASFAIYWIYSNSEERYWCTIELSSKNDRMFVSSLCNTVSLYESCQMEDVAKNMNCLYVSRGTFLGLLNENEEINLRVTIH